LRGAKFIRGDFLDRGLDSYRTPVLADQFD
jgi:hypothetical protein